MIYYSFIYYLINAINYIKIFIQKMEVERYKMNYTKIISEKLKWKLPYDLLELIDKSDNIRILGNDFVKNNKNKGKLIINTIFLF